MQDRHVFHIPFNFSAVARDSTSSVDVNVTQGDMLVHGMTIWNSESSDADPNIYWLRLFNLEYGQSLMSNFVSGLGILQTDARTVFRFPSPWYVQKGLTLRMQLRNPSDEQLSELTGSSYTVTAQVCLICECFPKGLPVQPVKQPMLLSYFAPLGFQEDTTSGGNVVNSANLYPSYQASWPPLLWNFELTSICMDSGNFNYDQIANLHMVQVIERKTKRQLLHAPATQANVSGGRSEDVFNAMNISDPAGWPTANALTHNLAVPIYCKAGSQLTAKLSFNLNYIGTTQTISNLNQTANIVLMGNKYETPDRFPAVGRFDNIRHA